MAVQILEYPLEYIYYMCSCKPPALFGWHGAWYESRKEGSARHEERKSSVFYVSVGPSEHYSLYTLFSRIGRFCGNQLPGDNGTVYSSFSTVFLSFKTDESIGKCTSTYVWANWLINRKGTLGLWLKPFVLCVPHHLASKICSKDPNCFTITTTILPRLNAALFNFIFSSQRI